MKLISRLCHICHNWHNHVSCPYCGAIKLGKTHYDRYNGRELVRSHGLPRILASQIEPMMTSARLVKVVSRNAQSIAR